MPQQPVRTTCRESLASVGTLLLVLATAFPYAAGQGATGAASSQGVAVWIRDTRQWPGYANAGMVRLDTATLRMRIGDTRGLLPVVTGSTESGNLYLDVCVPVDVFEVTASPAWPTVEVERWDCVPYSAYIPPAGGSAEAAPREPLRFRALTAGAYTFRYKVVTANSRPVEGEFSIVVGR
jgi:hypothetical protein